MNLDTSLSGSRSLKMAFTIVLRDFSWLRPALGSASASPAATFGVGAGAGAGTCTGTGAGAGAGASASLGFWGRGVVEEKMLERRRAREAAAAEAMAALVGVLAMVLGFAGRRDCETGRGVCSGGLASCTVYLGRNGNLKPTTLR